MPVNEFFITYFARKFLDSAWNKVKKNLKTSSLENALKQSCSKVALLTGSDTITSYTYQALLAEEGILEQETLHFQLEDFFKKKHFPSKEDLFASLITTWKARRCHLKETSEPDFFFNLTELEITPILREIANIFYDEIVQIKVFRQKAIIKMLQEVHSNLNLNNEIELTKINEQDLANSFLKSSSALLSWPITLGSEKWLERSEISILIDNILRRPISTTLLLGKPGTGKSALLAVLGQKLQSDNILFLAIKADKIPKSIDDPESLKNHFNLPYSVNSCLRFLSKNRKVVLIIDQLDALSELVDRKTERLNVLLNLVQDVSGIKNVHVVCSSRLFEYRHDTRLTSIDAENLNLELPSWNSVNEVLVDSKVSLTNISDEFQTLLTVPLHLKLFLDLELKNPSEVSVTSLYGLLELLWEKRVLCDHSGARGELIKNLTNEMAKSEELWVARAFADNYQIALIDLIREEILADEHSMSIAFRHQTYFDFSRARIFASGEESLSVQVIQNQDSLFIRPILLASLEYLKNANRNNYHNELLALWKNVNLRNHLYILLIEYLASIELPDSTEISCLIPLIKEEKKCDRIFKNMAGSIGWFDVIKKALLPEFMSQPLQGAYLTLPVLEGALVFSEYDVLKLVKDRWIPDLTYDNLSIQLLQKIKRWSEETVALIELISQRSDVWGIENITDIVSQDRPELASKIVRAVFDRKLKKAEEKDKAKPITTPPTENSSPEEHMKYMVEYEPYKEQKRLLEDRNYWHGLSLIAESSPESFLKHMWPWFLVLIGRICGSKTVNRPEYIDDGCLATDVDYEFAYEDGPVQVIKTAITKLSKIDEVAFVDFFKMNVDSPYLAIHIQLCTGLINIVSSQTDLVFNYITSDSRRLAIGGISDVHKQTVVLISSVFSYLSVEQRNTLEKKILEWNKYSETCLRDEATDRRDINKWTRQHRLRLLRAIPVEYLSRTAKKIFDEEERAFPGLNNWDFHIEEGGIVGSPMSASQMLKAKDRDVRNLFNIIDDSTGWDYPKTKPTSHRMSGGVIQASRAFEEFAQNDPNRAINIISSFEPGKHEIPCGMGLTGLAKSGIESKDLFQLLKDLSSKGFISSSFRLRATDALEIVAKSNDGLPNEIVEILESWILFIEEPLQEDVAQEKPKEKTNSILWETGGIHFLPGGRDRIFSTIAVGYLNQKPSNVDGWHGVLQRALKYEKHPDVWKSITGHMHYLFNGDRDKATRIYNNVMSMYDEVLLSTQGVYAVARVMRNIDDQTIIHKWLERYFSANWHLGSHAFGELSVLHLTQKPEDSHVRKILFNQLDNAQNVPVHRGATATASANWHSRLCQPLCTEVILKLYESDDEITQINLQKIFKYGEEILLNDVMKEIIYSYLNNNLLTARSAESLVGGIEYATAAEPEFVCQVCNSVLDACSEKTDGLATSASYWIESIVSISLTLQRIPDFKSRGLLLFERLLENNISEAESALELLDRKPRTKQLPLSRRRRRLKRINKSRPVN